MCTIENSIKNYLYLFIFKNIFVSKFFELKILIYLFFYITFI